MMSSRAVSLTGSPSLVALPWGALLLTLGACGGEASGPGDMLEVSHSELTGQELTAQVEGDTCRTA